MTTEEAMLLTAAKHGMGNLVTGHSPNLFREAMILHTKHHVEEALKKAADMSFVEVVGENEAGIGIYEVDKESILNAYPLENIE